MDEQAVPVAETESPRPQGEGPPSSLIDPKLQGRALKRLQGIIKGNGLRADAVKIEDCGATVFPFRARTFIKLLPKYGVRTEPGQNRVAELVGSQEDFNRALKNAVVDARVTPEKRKAIVEFLFKRPDKGFGLKDQTIGFHTLERDFVMHEGCPTCSKAGKVPCHKCRTTGIVTCATCQGRKQINCPQCRGSGKTPGSNQAHSCTRCRGDGKIRCTQCTGSGQTKCPVCAAAGTLKCQKCAATGWISHLAHLEMEARLHFDFEREVLPIEVQKMVEAFGPRLVQKGDIEVLLHPQPETELAIRDEARRQNEPDDMIFVDYQAKVPYGPINFRLRERVIPAILFGYHGKLIEAPSFLDDLLRKGQQALAEAAQGAGDVADKIQRAAKYRLLCDVIVLAASQVKQRQAMEILTNRYPTGIAADRLLKLLINADKALKAITRKPRSIGLAVGSTGYAVLVLVYVFYGRLAVAATGQNPLTLAGIDTVLLPLGAGLIVWTAQIFAHTAQRKATSGLNSRDLAVSRLPKAGKTLWWAVIAALVIWTAAFAAQAALLPQASPAWLQSLMGVAQH